MSALEQEVHRYLASSEQADEVDNELISDLIRQADPLRSAADLARSVAQVRSHLSGYGLIDPLLASGDVTDIMINGPGTVWVERAGAVEPTSIELDRPAIELLVQRMVAPLGRRADPMHPFVDGRLADGSRLHIAVPPIAIDGPVITIRRFPSRSLSLADFASSETEEVLRSLVVRHANLVVSGRTGSGKTSLLNALGAELDRGERVVTIEEAAELRIDTDHVVRLEARPEEPGGPSSVTVRTLVRNALRMRPDRLIVGEVRGAEAFDLIMALSTGHAGSMSTVHANSAADAVARLEALAHLAGVSLGHQALAHHLRSALDVVIHVERCGPARRVVEVFEVGPPGSPGRMLVPDDGGRSTGLAS